MTNKPIYAYPSYFTSDQERFDMATRGMTLRDYFAAKALQSLAISYEDLSDERLAKRVYQLADAMMEARNA